MVFEPFCLISSIFLSSRSCLRRASSSLFLRSISACSLSLSLRSMLACDSSATQAGAPREAPDSAFACSVASDIEPDMTPLVDADDDNEEGRCSSNSCTGSACHWYTGVSAR